jgi:hypothetical protein
VSRESVVRPIYESIDDISNEERLAEHLMLRWELDGWKRNPRMYPIDISFIKDDVIKGFAEIKCRTVSVDTYETYMISVSKVIAAQSLSKATGLGCYLVVKWTDSLGWISFGSGEKVVDPRPGIIRPKFVAWGGRSDREDPQDMEPVIHFDIDDFRMDYL